MTQTPSDRVETPREPIHSLVAPIVRFLHVEAASGFVLLAATLLALALANSPAADGFLASGAPRSSLRSDRSRCATRCSTGSTTV